MHAGVEKGEMAIKKRRRWREEEDKCGQGRGGGASAKECGHALGGQVARRRVLKSGEWRGGKVGAPSASVTEDLRGCRPSGVRCCGECTERCVAVSPGHRPPTSRCS